MIKISKAERFTLEEKYGLRMNSDIQPTHSKPRKYFMVTTPRNMKLINKLRGI